jgi:hypothetical protein
LAISPTRSPALPKPGTVPCCEPEEAELQAAGETLKSDADELVDESLTDAQIKSGLEAAVDEYEAGIASVKAQAGCSTQ